MEIKIKRLHPDAKMPKRGTSEAAGFDLYATEDASIVAGEPKKIPTGLAFEIPSGYVGVVYSRSSSALKGLVITPLLVDADYRGEVFVLANYLRMPSTAIGGMLLNHRYDVRAGDRIAQMRIEKLENTEFKWVEDLSKTERGDGGYGSTGR